MGTYQVFPPSKTGTKIIEVLCPSVVTDTVPNPYLLESQAHQFKWYPCLGDARSFNFLHQYFKGQLVAPIPTPTCALSSPSAIRDGGTVTRGELNQATNLHTVASNVVRVFEPVNEMPCNNLFQQYQINEYLADMQALGYRGVPRICLITISQAARPCFLLTIALLLIRSWIRIKLQPLYCQIFIVSY